MDNIIRRLPVLSSNIMYLYLCLLNTKTTPFGNFIFFNNNITPGNAFSSNQYVSIISIKFTLKCPDDFNYDVDNTVYISRYIKNDFFPN